MQYLWFSISNCIAFIIRSFLKLRYQVEIKGLEKIPENPHSCLIAPNHPSMLDPFLLVPFIWKKIQPRPLAWKPTMPFFVRCWMDPLIQPIYISEKSNKAVALKTMITSLNEGKNMILYPSGMLSRVGVEVLGKVRGISAVLQNVPNLTLILVRTRGLFGSRSTWGYAGKEPNLAFLFLSGLFIVLSNLLFFVPKRKVKIEIEVIDASFFSDLKLETINKELEKWYNSPTPETISLVKTHFLSFTPN